MAGSPSRRALLTHLAVVLAVLSCSEQGRRPSSAPTAGVVVVASFDFSENALLAEVYAAALEASGVRVARELRLGTREQVHPALHQGLVDVVPEYLGSALRALGEAPEDPRDVPAARARLAAAVRPWHLRVLTPSPAQDQNGFAVSRGTATALRLRTLSDLARVSRELTLTGPPECPQRPLCLLGLANTYGARFARFLPYATEQQRLDAVTQGLAHVGLVFTTDGRIGSSDLVLLRDDKGLQPAENVTPIVSERAIRTAGRAVVTVLEAVSAALDSDALRFLNWRVQVAGNALDAEAQAWVLRHPEVTSALSTP